MRWGGWCAVARVSLVLGAYGLETIWIGWWHMAIGMDSLAYFGGGCNLACCLVTADIGGLDWAWTVMSALLAFTGLMEML